MRKEPEVYIADRANNRIEVFSPELEYKRTIPDVLAPCCFYQHDNQLRPVVFALPHALTLSSTGDLYVVEWVPTGRPRKFRRVKG